jgi:hypothetical protein
MKRGLTAFMCFLAGVGSAFAQDTTPTRQGVSYTLLEGSYFVDDCLVCGRPTIEQPMRGTFDLVLVQNTPPYISYAIQNVDFTTEGPWLNRHITGQGTYVRFEEFARLQDMTLAVKVSDQYTNRTAYFTNQTRVATNPFPLIQANLMETNGTLLQTFSLQLFAAPVREIWFSTSRSFISTNRNTPTNKISAGDLLSNRGRVVKRNIDLVGRLGVMPSVPDLGLDAVDVTGRGEILFSLPVDVFSETLGQIQHGDLLSNRGAIVRRNQDLLAAFKPDSTADAGLDAVQIMPDGEILFSIQTNVVVSSTLTLRRGDILSDRGRVFMTQRQLLANFQPAVTNHDFGLDALHVLPSGEIWFSVEESFTDQRLGAIQAGDLLSNNGYIVLRNGSLLSTFAPSDPTQDYGLDGLFVVTDTQPPKPCPRIVKQGSSGNRIHLEWDGEGNVFQVEQASALVGPWLPGTEILPDLSCDIDADVTSDSASFYRLRQW